MNARSRPRWFLFTSTEIEVTLGVFAFAETLLVILDAERPVLIAFACAYVVTAYLAGLIVHSRSSKFRFVRDGAVGGAGYVPYFRRAKRGLLLLHTDDDPPGEELLGLYRAQLERGVELRRVIFLRPEQGAEALDWVRRFGGHPRLLQRFVQREQASLMRLSFVVVDEQCVLIAVPGNAAVESEAYTPRLAFSFSERSTRYIVDSEARYSPRSASAGTICLGDESRNSRDVTILTTRRRSLSERLFLGRVRGPARRSWPMSWFFQRWTVRGSIPRTAHASFCRAPASVASSMSPRITSRSSCPCRSPRPPRSRGLFFGA